MILKRPAELIVVSLGSVKLFWKLLATAYQGPVCTAGYLGTVKSVRNRFVSSDVPCRQNQLEVAKSLLQYDDCAGSVPPLLWIILTMIGFRLAPYVSHCRL